LLLCWHFLAFYDGVLTMLRSHRVLLTPMLAGVLGLSALSAAAEPHRGGDRASEERNVILIVGDGMGYNSVDLASLYEHGTAAYQSQEDNAHLAADGGPARESQLYQHFATEVGVETGYVFSPPYESIDAWASARHVTRDNPDQEVLVTDSGAAATAMSTGVRTRGGYLGWDRDENPLQDMVDVASTQGMATGLVTSGRFWGDTTAGFAVHAEDDDSAEIIDQLLFHPDLDVIMGGGHPGFNNDGTPKPEPHHEYMPADIWAALHGETTVDGLPDWTLVDERDEFRALAAPGTAKRRGVEVPEQVLGLAQTDGALFHDRPGKTDVPFAEPMADNIPPLDEMALANLNILARASETGFFTVIEAATIDSAAHHGQLGRQIEAQVALNHTAEAVAGWVRRNSSWQETTVIVTSDHETGNLWGSGTRESGTFQPLTGNQNEVPAAEHADFTEADPADPDQPPHYHTHQLVPLFAHGALADELAATATSTDPVRGAYLHNTDIATTIRDHLTE